MECRPGVQNTAVVEDHCIAFLQGVLVGVCRVIEQSCELSEGRIECGRGGDGKWGLEGRRVVNVLDLWGIGRSLRAEGRCCCRSQLDSRVFPMKMMAVVEVVEGNGRFGQNIEISRGRFVELVGGMQSVDKDGGAANDAVPQTMENLIARRMLEVAKENGQDKDICCE